MAAWTSRAYFSPRCFKQQCQQRLRRELGTRFSLRQTWLQRSESFTYQSSQRSVPWLKRKLYRELEHIKQLA